jgi:hypothetical protein
MSKTEGSIDSVQKAQWNAFFRSVVDEINAQGMTSVPEVPLIFPRQFNEDERRIVQAFFELRSFTSMGDGFDMKGAAQNATRYLANANWAGAAGVAIGSLIAKQRLKGEEEVKWRVMGNGNLIVTDYGIYLILKQEAYTKGKNTWMQACDYPPFVIGNDGISSAQLTAWDCLEYDIANSDGGRKKYMIISPLASLIFVLWCLAMYPNHPQLQEVVDCWL